ncbi:MAG: DUF3524 domain-containing protein [Anaerolineae bacterium]|nr:DUF3524 domain-containing protein [Anaerolineae bacterium]
MGDLQEMRVWLIEPYFRGSHRAWAEGYARYSSHRIELFTMTGAFWKWRMLGGAMELARQVAELRQQGQRPDVILASEMVNLPALIGLARPCLSDVPVVLYFHENQLTYPLPPGERRDLSFGIINWLSALTADRICFNSRFHLEQFFDEVPRLLKHFPDYQHLSWVDQVRRRAQVLPIGCDLLGLDALRPDEMLPPGPPIILWNQRWEYDKNPEMFFAALHRLAAEGIPFRVAVAGENVRQQPEEFEAARQRLGERVIHWGFVENRGDYARLLWQADVVVSTARHEFFGIAVVEAIYCGCHPLLPRDLSYPEIIPSEWHSECLYEGLDDLVDRLRQVLQQPRVASPALRQAMSRFDWSNLAPLYDALLLEAAQLGRQPLWENGL